MSFLLIVDEKISRLKEDIRNTRVQRLKEDFYINFVSKRINESIEILSKSHPEERSKIIADTLVKVPEFISESFTHIERIESNLVLTLGTYENIKSEFSEWENKNREEENNKSENSKKNSEKHAEKDTIEETKEKKETKKRKIRKIGEKPADKLKPRRKKKDKDLK
tara:strand:- start:242 stop:739 length:498 start_codon:yes stop_codon:yes gene_type:complete